MSATTQMNLDVIREKGRPFLVRTIIFTKNKTCSPVGSLKETGTRMEAENFFSLPVTSHLPWSSESSSSSL